MRWMVSRCLVWQPSRPCWYSMRWKIGAPGLSSPSQPPAPWRQSKVSCKARGRSVLWKPCGLPSPCTGGASALWINSSSHHALPTPLAVERAIVALRARLITRIASAYVPIVAVISIGRWWCGRVVHGTPAPPLRADGPWLRMIRLISQNCL